MRRGAGRVGFVVWRLYPNPRSRLFVRVLVFDRRCALQETFRRVVPRAASRIARRTRAFCIEIERYYTGPGGTFRRHPAVASVLLWRRDIGAGIVAHEMTHALAAWARRTGLDLASLTSDWEGHLSRESPEESAAETLGELVRQFYVRAQAAGLY